MSDPVQALKADADEIKSALSAAGHLSLLITAEDVIRRNLLISAASYFEHDLCKRIENVFSSRGYSEECVSLIRSKAIVRQFYSYFDFNSSNTNRLFSAFGQACKERASNALRSSSALRESQSSFLQICGMRNNMVHENFAAFSMDVSSDEVVENFRRGLRFLDFFEVIISGNDLVEPA